MKVAILARNYTDEESRRLLTDAGFEILDQPQMELGIGAGGLALRAYIRDADAVIAGLEGYSADLLERCPNLKLISRRGIGYDSVDLAACQRLGVAVVRTVGQVEGAVAEHLMALLLHFARNVGNAESKELAEALLGAVKYNGTSRNMTDAYGLSIYFPYQKMSTVNSAVQAYEDLGLDDEYAECIRRFASIETGGQAVSGCDICHYSESLFSQR